MHPSAVPIVVLLLSAGFAGRAAAHGGEPVLYVDVAGTDIGLCNDPQTPCRSIGYALRQAGRETEIRVAAGRYPVAGEEELFHIVSGVVTVNGGFDRNSGYDAAGKTVTTLTGVPLQYRRALTTRGFHVIADSKGDEKERATATDKLLSVHRQLKSGAAPEVCTGGMAGELPCDNVDLLGHFAFNDLRSRPSAANDIWGFVDLNSGREYVVAGFNLGTAVLDVSDPDNPREVAFVSGQNSVWRDVKVLQRFDNASGRWHAWAYVTTDAGNDGLFVLDLGGLPHSVRRESYASDFASSHNLQLTNTDPSTGLAVDGGPQYLVLAGSNRNAGQMRAYALADPASPALLQGNAIPNTFGGSDPSYAHDLSFLRITDARAGNCPNATAACDVMLDFNEENIEVWDTTDIAAPERLNPARQEYAQRGYVHSGWPTEDRQFVFVQDELDERNFDINTTLRIFSIADLAAPVLAGTWTGPTGAVDHNGFVRGNRYYMSNYSRGLTVLDITDPVAPVEAGRIDTFPFSNSGGFVGAWGVYPYFASGTIAISDMDSGVYLARDRSRTVAAGSFAFDRDAYAAVENQDAVVTVQRTGGTAGNVSVDYEVVQATASDADYTLSFATLSWGDGDGSDRAITVSPANDGVAEGNEILLLRLVNPGGGATLQDRNTAWLHFSDPGDAPTVTLLDDTIEANEQGFARAVLIVQRHGSAAGDVSIDFTVAAGDATAGTDYRGPANGTLSWPDGDAKPRSIAFDIDSDGEAEAEEFFEVALGNASGATLTGNAVARITIPANSAVNAAPVANAGNDETVAENSPVALDGSLSSDPDGDALTFQWNQTGGPGVELAGAASASATFTSPVVAASTALQFQLRITDPGGLSDIATVTITVTDTTSASGNGGGGGGAGLWLLLLACACWFAAPASRTGVCGRSSVRGPARSK